MSWKQQGQLERTTLRRVRTNSPARRRNAAEFGREKGCFYSCLGCFQFGNGKWNLSDVLGTIGVEQKINGIDLLYAVEVCGRIAVEGEQELRMIVPDELERLEFALEGSFVTYSECDLIVCGRGVFKSDEIDLICAERSDKHFAVAAFQFEKNDVFKHATEVSALVAQQNAAESGVGNVVLGVRLQKVTSANVVAICAEQQERITEQMEVAVDRLVVDGESIFQKGSGNAVDGEQVADIVKDELRQSLEEVYVTNAIACRDVLVEDRIENAGKIVILQRSILGQQHRGRESSESHVVLDSDVWNGMDRLGAHVFGEGQRMQLYLNVASGQEGSQFARKKFAVGSSDVNIAIFSRKDSVNQPFEIGHDLHFIQKDVVFPASLHLRVYEFPCFAISCEGGRTDVFKVDRDDVLLRNAFLDQNVAENFQQCGFTATSDACDNLDDVMIAPFTNPIDKQGAVYYVAHYKNSFFGEEFGCIITKIRIMVNFGFLDINKMQLSRFNLGKEGCFQFEKGEEKQQGQLVRTTFRGVRANSPAYGRNVERKGGVSALVSDSEQVGMGAGVGKRQNKFTVGRIKIEKYPVVFDVAITQSLKITRERMVFVLRRQCFSHGEGADNSGNLSDVLPAFEHLFEALFITGGLANRVLHESINSMILSGSVHESALGSAATCFASLYASTNRWCLLLRVRAKGIPPTSRTLTRKQLNAVDMFMPMSSKMSSTSALSSASVRNVMVVVIDCTPVVNTFASIVAYCTDRSNTILKAA